MAATLAAAQQWMITNADADGRLPYGVFFPAPAQVTGTALGQTLDNWNHGNMDVPHCN